MNKPKIVSIGGIEYDNHTGLPIKTQAATAPVAAPPKKASAPKRPRATNAVHAKGVHATQQRSATLNRRFVTKKAKPAAKPVMSDVVVKRTPKQAVKGTPASQLHARSKNLDIRPKAPRSAHISKFAKEPQAHAVKRVVKPVAATPAHVPHPTVQKARSVQAAKQNPKPSITPITKPAATPARPHTPTARDIKHAELGKALANSKVEKKAPKAKRHSRLRLLNVGAASLGILLMAGYFTYINMPNLSVRVAAAQAGIEARYPEYHPVGYSLNGPVAYQNGQVNMKFASNTGPVAFQLNQAKSGWDSAALLEKFVTPESENKYATYNDGGLTIYTYGTNAAWVNGGILYTIEGDANLSNEQIRRIATSM